VKKSTSLKMDAIKILQDLMFHAKLQHVDILLIETRKWIIFVTDTYLKLKLCFCRRATICGPSLTFVCHNGLAWSLSWPNTTPPTKTSISQIQTCLCCRKTCHSQSPTFLMSHFYIFQAHFEFFLSLGSVRQMPNNSNDNFCYLLICYMQWNVGEGLGIVKVFKNCHKKLPSFDFV